MYPTQPFTYEAVAEQQEFLRAMAPVQVSQDIAADEAPRACVIRFCASPGTWTGRLSLCRLLGAVR